MSDSLVITSKVKKYIKDVHGMRSSSDVADELTKIIITALARGAETARVENRRTIKASDVAPIESILSIIETNEE